MIFSFFWSEILAIYLSFLQLSCTAETTTIMGCCWEVYKSLCVVRWVLNRFDFYLLSYKIIDMYIQRLNFSYFASIYLLFRLVTKSSVNPIWRHLCLIKTSAIPGRIGNSWWRRCILYRMYLIVGFCLCFFLGFFFFI